MVSNVIAGVGFPSYFADPGGVGCGGIDQPVVVV